jgi:hypothetical protein
LNSWRALLLMMTCGAVRSAAQSPIGPVETLMRHVNFHVDSSVVLQIETLRGTLIPGTGSTPVVFDDPKSFTLAIDSAVITLTTSSLSDLLNRYVFAYKGTPLKGFKSEVDSGRLKQSGRLHGIPFSILAEVSVTPAGELRLHPVKIHLLGIGAAGLMHLFGLSLQKVANVERAPGVRIEKDDLLLNPTTMLPPPVTRGHLVGATAHDSALTLRFAQKRAGAPAIVPPDAKVSNYLYFTTHVIRFGRLTMEPADLFVVDHEPRDWFDFWLAHYKSQLENGISKTRTNGGLTTEWPDYNKVKH